MTARTPLRPGDPLPEGWRWVRLGDITTLIKNKIDPRRFPEELFALYSFPAYDAGQKPEVVRGSKIGSTKTIVQPGTVLFARLNPRIPRVWLVGEEHVGKAVASTEFLALFPTELVDSQWLQLWLLSPHVREEVRSRVKGATKSRERISAEQVLSLILPLPPFETQRRVVAWLDEAFSHLQAIKERHAEAEREAAALLPAKLAEVFGRAEKEEWRWVRLGEIFKLKNGKFIRARDLESNGAVRVYGSNGVIGFTNKGFVEKETIVIGRVGSSGAIHLAQPPAWISDNAMYVETWLVEGDIKFFVLTLRHSNLGQYAKQGAQPSISQREILQVKIPLPSLETQRRIVEEIEAFEEEARRIQKAQEESRVVLEQLEKSLLAEAFRPERWV